jgi:hypothetical protein
MKPTRRTRSVKPARLSDRRAVTRYGRSLRYGQGDITNNEDGPRFYPQVYNQRALFQTINNRRLFPPPSAPGAA